jgi:hypothetical protein
MIFKKALKMKTMTSEEKKAALIEKIGEQKVNELTQNIWLLIGALHTAKFAIAQFEPQKMKFEMKSRFNNLGTAINSFINNFEKSASPEDREMLTAVSFDNVAGIAELIAMAVLLPPNQIDWYIEECKKLTFVAINRENS